MNFLQGNFQEDFELFEGIGQFMNVPVAQAPVVHCWWPQPAGMLETPIAQVPVNFGPPMQVVPEQVPFPKLRAVLDLASQAPRMAGPHGGPERLGAQKPPKALLPDCGNPAKAVYVNTRQYKRIIARRVKRAKLEAEGKGPKVRKRYMHESRHRHALGRARGTGGRFINMKSSCRKADEATPHEQRRT